MAKKNSLLKVLMVGAAVAGVCYYASKKKTNIPVDMDDDLDLDDDLDGEEEKPEGKRSYVNLNFGTVEQKVQDVVTKVADTASKAASQVGSIVSQAEEKVVEFFDDRKAATAAPEAAPEEPACDACDADPNPNPNPDSDGNQAE